MGIEPSSASRGIRPEEVCAFGDAENDHDMLSWAGAGSSRRTHGTAAKERTTFVSTLERATMRRLRLRFERRGFLRPLAGTRGRYTHPPG